MSAVLRSALALPGEDAPTVAELFPREVCVVSFWLHANPADADYFDTLSKARDLVHRDQFNPLQPLRLRSTAPGFCDPGATQNFAATCSAAAVAAAKCPGPVGTDLCDPTWYNASRHCRSDVLIHETYHFLDLPGDGKDFPDGNTPAGAMTNADTMTQFGNDLIREPVDNCVPTLRSATAATQVRQCVDATPPPRPRLPGLFF
jgi:hypothetical protein